MTDRNSILDKIIRDKHGKVVMWQRPNLPLITWFVTLLLSDLFKHGTLHNLFSSVSFGALFTWAWLEIFRGSSWFRRSLGVIIMVMSVWCRVN